eukprot:COSAG01_NODE_42374_length_440_cov_3.580645_1_plen_46_part_01
MFWRRYVLLAGCGCHSVPARALDMKPAAAEGCDGQLKQSLPGDTAV